MTATYSKWLSPFLFFYLEKVAVTFFDCAILILELNTMHKKHKSKAYSLSELIVVVTILGIIAAFALPQLNLVIERMRAREGVHLLLALYQAQREYLKDEVKVDLLNCPNGCYQKGVAWSSDIGFRNYVELVELPHPASLTSWSQFYKNFSIPTLGCGFDDDCPGGPECRCTSMPANEIACNFPAPNNHAVLAQVRRNGTYPFNYNLYVTEEGRVVCGEFDSGGLLLSGPALCGGLCKKLGFPDDW